MSIETAKSLLSESEALLITAGAGMGVDSGLPDFRGTEGFWKAYPPYASLGLEFMSVANPTNFAVDPAFAWGFYGHRFNLYRHTVPHGGFKMLLDYGNEKAAGSFVYTSNVDGHFQKSGFSEEQVVECHGTINHYQCFFDCCDRILPTTDWQDFDIDESDMTAREPLPCCPDCGNTARPAILMFGDNGWNPHRTSVQENRYSEWIADLQERNTRIAIIELGAGTAIPTVRYQSESIASNCNGFLIRINPREPEIPAGIEGVELSMGGLEALELLLDCS